MHNLNTHDLRALERAELLAALERVSRDELPDGGARDALAEAIACDEIDGLYRPLGHTHHNVTLRHTPPAMDPRVRIQQWASWWDAGCNPFDEALAEYARRQR